VIVIDPYAAKEVVAVLGDTRLKVTVGVEVELLPLLPSVPADPPPPPHDASSNAAPNPIVAVRALRTKSFPKVNAMVTVLKIFD
jgi:hypothetical protein